MLQIRQRTWHCIASMDMRHATWRAGGGAGLRQRIRTCIWAAAAPPPHSGGASYPRSSATLAAHHLSSNSVLPLWETPS